MIKNFEGPVGGGFPSRDQGWQYGRVRSELEYYVPRTLNRTVPAYRTSVQFLKRTVPTYRTRTIPKKAYRTGVPYFLAKIEAYRIVLTYSAVATGAQGAVPPLTNACAPPHFNLLGILFWSIT